MSSLDEDEFYFDALDEEQFLRDVLATEEEEEDYFDASDDESFAKALNYHQRNQNGGGQFDFKLYEFRPRVNHRATKLPHASSPQ